MDTQRRQLIDFLKGCRARLSPGQVGLPDTNRRRTPGLRREDVAALAGVSVTWYTWLEQGRKIQVSADVLERVCTTLRMTPDERMIREMILQLKRGRLELFKTRRDQPDDEVTLDFVCDQLITYGTPDKVADEILKNRETVGDFGTLLYAGKDWKDRDLGRRSMVLLAEKVLPKVNAAIKK